MIDLVHPPDWVVELLKLSSNYRPVEPNEKIPYSKIGGSSYVLWVERGTNTAKHYHAAFVHHTPNEILRYIHKWGSYNGENFDPNYIWPCAMRKPQRQKAPIEKLPLP